MLIDDKAAKKTLNSVQSLFLEAIQKPNEANSTRAVGHIHNGVGLNAGQRLGIYQRGYNLRLLECMRAEYPLLSNAFSADWFDQMALHYLLANPSCSTSLNDLSVGFPAFLRNDRPDKNQQEKVNAFDFLISLAEFERAKIETSRGKGSEGTDVEQFLSIETTDLNCLEVRLADNVRIVHAQFDLLSYLERVDSDQIDHIEHDQFIIVCRENYCLRYFEISAWQFDLVRELEGSRGIGGVIEGIAQAYPSQPIYGLAPVFLTQLAMKGAVKSVTFSDV
jgi:hypothetical protein